MRLSAVIAAAATLAVSSQVSLASDPCDPAGASLGSGVYQFEHDGITRTFRVHVPKGYDEANPVAFPLVAIFHGWGGDENEFLGFKPVTSEADQRGYILVAPRGLGSGAPDFNFNSWSFSGSTTGLDGSGEDAICDTSITPDYSYDSCNDAGIAQNTCSWTHCQAGDVDFAVAMIDHIKANLCVDEDNVFATGGSNGGMFAWELGQNRRSAPTFGAIAPLIGLPHRGFLDPQGVRRMDLPVMVITGTRDTVVPPGDWEDPSFTTTSNFNDRYYYTGATAITRSWAEAHGCYTGVETAEPFDDGNQRTDCRTYCAEDEGWPRVLDCRVQMGHMYGLAWSWRIILDFFDAHSL